MKRPLSECSKTLTMQNKENGLKASREKHQSTYHQNVSIAKDCTSENPQPTLQNTSTEL